MAYTFAMGGSARRQKYRYRTHGIVVESEIALLHAAAEAGTKEPDLEICIGSYPVTGKAIGNRTWIRGSAEALQFDVADVGTFSCVAGRRIWIEQKPNASPVKVELFALGTALGIIHYQRGEFPIHGAFVASEARAWGFCGGTGEGKSTLGLTLARSGYGLLADDVAVVRPVDGDARVYAENTHLKLWENSVKHFALPIDSAVTRVSRSSGLCTARLDIGGI